MYQSCSHSHSHFINADSIQSAYFGANINIAIERIAQFTYHKRLMLLRCNRSQTNHIYLFEKFGERILACDKTLSNCVCGVCVNLKIVFFLENGLILVVGFHLKDTQLADFQSSFAKYQPSEMALAKTSDAT